MKKSEKVYLSAKKKAALVAAAKSLGSQTYIVRKDGLVEFV